MSYFSTEIGDKSIFSLRKHRSSCFTSKYLQWNLTTTHPSFVGPCLLFCQSATNMRDQPQRLSDPLYYLISARLRSTQKDHLTALQTKQNIVLQDADSFFCNNKWEENCNKKRVVLFLPPNWYGMPGLSDAAKKSEWPFIFMTWCALYKLAKHGEFYTEECAFMCVRAVKPTIDWFTHFC